MSIDVAAILNNFTKNLEKNANSSTFKGNSKYTVTESIFSKASELVAEYKEKKNNSNSSSSNNTFISNMSMNEIANMSTSDFLNYAYNNKANSGFNSTDSSGIELPMIVRYKTQVVSSAGKTFMQVVAKFKAKFPYKSEEEIAAELMAKYGTEETNTESASNNKKVSGNSLNLSA